MRRPKHNEMEGKITQHCAKKVIDYVYPWTNSISRGANKGEISVSVSFHDYINDYFVIF